VKYRGSLRLLYVVRLDDAGPRRPTHGHCRSLRWRIGMPPALLTGKGEPKLEWMRSGCARDTERVDG
jgi:hypothetical protein